MITILVFLFSLVLLFIGYLMMAKQRVFFSLIEDTSDNRNFLRRYGMSYGFAGLLGFVMLWIDHKWLTLTYLLCVVVIAGSFSFFFADRMKKIPKK